jgi:hypothetical protein
MGERTEQEHDVDEAAVDVVLAAGRSLAGIADDAAGRVTAARRSVAAAFQAFAGAAAPGPLPARHDEMKGQA